VSQVRSMLNCSTYYLKGTACIGQCVCTRYRGVSHQRVQRVAAPNLSRFRIGSLELFLHQEIGIEEDAAIAYLSDGRRLTNSNIRDLGSAQDQVCVRDLAVVHELTPRRLSLYSTSSTSTMISILFFKNSTMSRHYTLP